MTAAGQQPNTIRKAGAAKPRYCIGIDPGHQTGLAIWDRAERQFLMIETTTILRAQTRILQFVAENTLRESPQSGKVRDQPGDCTLYVENPNLRTWFGKKGSEALQGAGSVKRDYSVWEEFSELTGLPIVAVHPKNVMSLPGEKGAGHFAALTRHGQRTSVHAREAAIMVFGL